MSLLNHQVFKPETLAAIAELGPTAEVVADRWAGGWPKDTKALEKAGKLIPVLKAQAQKESETLSDARVGGMNNHLATHEIAELYGIDLQPPTL